MVRPMEQRHERAFRAEKFKSAMRDQWDQHAKGWNDHGAQIADWLREPTDAMLAMAEVASGARVIDIAAGAGDQTLAIAKRVGTTGSVLATDLSPAILAFTQENARRADCGNVETQVADGEISTFRIAGLTSRPAGWARCSFPIRARVCARCSAC